MQIPVVTAGLTGNAPGEIDIAGVEGDVALDFSNTNFNNQVVEVCIGMYIAHALQPYGPTGKWTVQDPSANTDAQEDNWFMLRCMAFPTPTYVAGAPVGGTPVPVVNIPVSMPVGLRLGGNEALAFVVGSNITGSGTLSVRSYLRTRYRRSL